MGAEVRALSGDDVDLSRAMLALFGREFGDKATCLEKQPDDRHLRRLLQRDTFVAIVALADSHVVGGLAAKEVIA